MIPTISNLLLQRAEAYPDLLPQVQDLSLQIKRLNKSNCSLKSYVALQEYFNDIPLMHFVEDTLRECDDLPNLQQPDYKAYVTLLALSPDSYIVAFLLDYLVNGYIRHFRVDELLFFTDLLREINPGRNLLNGVFNGVCYFFYDQRREVLKNRQRRLTDEQFRYAERNMPELGNRSFRMEVEIKAYGVYTVQELAEKCGMEYGSFRKRFLKEFGITAGNWIEAQRIEDIKMMLRADRCPLTEIAIRTGFTSPSSFNDFCVKHLALTPGELRKNYQKQQKTEGCTF